MIGSKNKEQASCLKCFICGGTFRYLFSQKDVVYFTSDKYFDLYECDGCNLVKILPEPALDEIASFYPEDYYSQCVYEKKSFIGWLYNCSVDAVLNEHYGLSQPNMFYVFLALLCKNFLTGVPLSPPKANGKFLDVGCGAGYWGGGS